LAADYLEQAGVKIIEHNYRCRKGEIDLIGQQGDFLVFFEVRTRNSSYRGSAEESIGPQKIQKMKIIAAYYLMEQRYREYPKLRFDAVAINFAENTYSFNWIQGLS